MNVNNKNQIITITINELLGKVDRGEIKLPRFQRKVAWDEGTSANLMESILRGNPIGLLLMLEVEDRSKPPFKTREIPGALETKYDECEELLLDGQQRVMSLYRAVEDSFDKSFIVEFKLKKLRQRNIYEIIKVHKIKKPKSSKGPIVYNSTNLPEEITEYFFPLRLFSHRYEIEKEADEWIQSHTKEYELDTEEIKEAFRDIKLKFFTYHIPMIRLLKTTSKKTAINIFIQMNRSVAKLSAFDIAVAQMEEERGISLHDRVSDIAKKTILLGNLGEDDAKKERKIGDFVLRTFCLRQGENPTEGNFPDLNFDEIKKDWPKFERAIEQMNRLLNQEKVWDEKRLPSLVPLHVIVALFMEDQSPDKTGQYFRVLRSYLWRAFLSDRYSYAANKHMKEDYDRLSQELPKPDLNEADLRSKVPIFGKLGEIPEVDDIKNAGWPSSTNRVGRAILILTLKKEAMDIATDNLPTVNSINSYEYHHIYPKGYIQDIESDFKKSALNCMFLSRETNNMVRDKAPSEYLMERMEQAVDIPVERRQEQLAEKLETHIIPIDELMRSKPKKTNNRKQRQRNFEKFIKQRAIKIHEEICKILDSN